MWLYTGQTKVNKHDIPSLFCVLVLLMSWLQQFWISQCNRQVHFWNGTTLASYLLARFIWKCGKVRSICIYIYDYICLCVCFSLVLTRTLTPSNDFLGLILSCSVMDSTLLPISSMLAWPRHRARSRMTRGFRNFVMGWNIKLPVCGIQGEQEHINKIP